MSRENKKGKIIAVTGCPTGIAHTFIAEEKFKKVAKKLGVDIKVETHGQVGIGNKLTEEEIGEAMGVIIAADKDVDAGRFVGKRVIEVSVSKGIKKCGGTGSTDYRWGCSDKIRRKKGKCRK